MVDRMIYERSETIIGTLQTPVNGLILTKHDTVVFLEYVWSPLLYLSRHKIEYTDFLKRKMLLFIIYITNIP